MKLSVIIVNYNVKHFLEQAIVSVLNACKDLDTEIFVVDNCSVDGSVAMLKDRFPYIHVISNQENVGFSKANNQAIELSKGEFVLLLNPDTLVAEDTFIKCVHFMESTPAAGAIGVKMIDGTGTFLPESKRALPTPWVSFCKIFGLSALFPKSKLFSQYHLGHLPSNENHEVAVLSGAYMFIRRIALEKAGLLDETFFMYGEDIDLSYRLLKTGYKNYFFAESTILHYKGESTKKGNLNYVKTFYEAMIIYAEKHFSTGNANIYTFTINLAIYFKAALTVASQLFKNGWLPIFDFAVSYVGIYFLKELWENKIMHDNDYYNEVFVFFFIPVYVLTWLLFAFLSGAYDKPIRTINIIKGIGIGTLVLTAVFGLLPNELRFSRAIILMGALWVTLSFFANRFFYQIFNQDESVFREENKLKIVIVGEVIEATRVLTLLNESGKSFTFIGFVSPLSESFGIEPAPYVANLNNIDLLCQLLSIDEVVFCNKNVSAKNIILTMEKIKTNPCFKTVPENSNSIIGSNSKNTMGDLYSIDSDLKIGQATGRRNKYLFDLSLSFLFICFFPFYLICFKKAWSVLLKDLCLVIIGKKTWIGYIPMGGVPLYRLPKLVPGVFNLLSDDQFVDISQELGQKINLLYAREYTVYSDLLLIWKRLVRKNI